MSKILINLIVSFGLLLISSFSVNAQNENKLEIRSYGSFLHTERVPNALFLSKDIERNDNFEIRKALRNHDIDILVLSNFGGSLEESLNIAGIIQEKELTTYLPKLGVNDQGICLSACSVIFFGGKTRVAEGKLGVSQFFSSSTPGSSKTSISQALKQYTEAEIIDLLNETFETPSFVFKRMFQQKEIYYFNDKELKQISRVINPLEQEERDSISKFINDFKRHVAPNEIEGSQKNSITKKVEPKTSVEIISEPTTTGDEFKARVKSFQRELNRLNCNAGPEDGVPGDKTRKAVENFLKTNELISANTNYREVNFQEELLDIIRNSNKKCTAVPKPKKTAQAKDMLVCDKQLAAKGTGSADVLIIYDFLEIAASKVSGKWNYNTSAIVDICNIYGGDERELSTSCFRYDLYHYKLGPQKYLSFVNRYDSLNMYLDKNHTKIKIRHGGAENDVTVGNCKITKSYTHKGDLKIWDSEKQKYIKNN